MSLTKHHFWEEICAMNDDFDEREFRLEPEAADETQIDFFDDYKLAHGGYEEIQAEEIPVFDDEDLPW